MAVAVLISIQQREKGMKNVVIQKGLPPKVGSELKDPDLSILAIQLRGEILKKEEYLRSAASSINETPERHPDPIDKASTENLNNINGILAKRDIEKITEINEALIRVVDGTYGICEDCGEPIDARRLEVQPTALRCVPCEQVIEQLRKRH